MEELFHLICTYREACLLVQEFVFWMWIEYLMSVLVVLFFYASVIYYRILDMCVCTQIWFVLNLYDLLDLLTSVVCSWHLMLKHWWLCQILGTCLEIPGGPKNEVLASPCLSFRMSAPVCYKVHKRSLSRVLPCPAWLAPITVLSVKHNHLCSHLAGVNQHLCRMW